MPRPYSMDLRERVLDARQDGLTQVELARRFQVSESTVYSWLRRQREQGTVRPRPHGGGQPPAVDQEGAAVLGEIVRRENDLTLDEYRERYRESTGVEMSRSALWRALARLEITRKKGFIRCLRPAQRTRGSVA